MTINFGKFEYDHGEGTFRAYAEIESATSRILRQLALHEDERIKSMFREAFEAGHARCHDEWMVLQGGGSTSEPPDFDEWLAGFITERLEASE